MDFEPVNVHGNPAAQAELTAQGVPRVPATVLDGRIVHGWNPAELARLVGVDFDDTPALQPAELAQALDNILYYSQHLVKRLTPEQLAITHPERKRVLRDLAFHIFRIGSAFVDTLEQGMLRQEWYAETAPAEMKAGEDIAAYGQQVRERLADWFAQAPPEVFGQTAHTYYGDQPTHHLLERTTWHAGQHLRQVYDLLETHDALPVPPLSPELFEGLPMPAELW